MNNNLTEEERDNIAYARVLARRGQRPEEGFNPAQMNEYEATAINVLVNKLEETLGVIKEDADKVPDPDRIRTNKRAVVSGLRMALRRAEMIYGELDTLDA